MLYEIEPRVTIDPQKDQHAFHQEVKQIADLIQTFPWGGFEHRITTDGDMIWVVTIHPLTEAHRANAFHRR